MKNKFIGKYMKINKIIILLGVIWSFGLLAGWEENITQVDDGLYTAKIVNRPLWLVMEKIDDKNLEFWQKYAGVQDNPRVLLDLFQRFPKYSSDGADHFASVLSKVDPNKNEIWVAYVTSGEKPRHITKEDVDGYFDPSYKTKTGFFDNIVMFVTIASSPQALITSHMGVSASYEGLMRDIRGVSKDLHSFGAKVTIMRNPDRKYMVNAPNTLMGSILAKAVPKGSFFAGNRELPDILEKEINRIEEKIQNASDKDKMRKDILEMAKLDQEIENRRLMRAKGRFENKEIDEKEYLEIKARILDPENLNRNFLTVDNDENIFISDELVEKKLRQELEDTYGMTRIKPGYDLLKSYGPQLISVDGSDGKTAENKMTIFDKDNLEEPWLVIDRGNPNYDWIFTEPFEPMGRTYYIAVDLKALADISEIEPKK